MVFQYEVLSKSLESRGIRRCEFARACNGLAPQTISQILSGWIRPGKKRCKDIAVGLQTLGFSENEIVSVLGGPFD